MKLSVRLDRLYGVLQGQAQALSYMDAYWVLAVAATVMFFGSLLLKKNEPGKGATWPCTERSGAMSLMMGFCLTVLTLVLQCAGIVALIEWLRRLAPRNLRDLRVFRSAILVLQTTVALLVLHGLIISLWASCYHWLCVPSWDSSLYFSACTYATVGYADVVLSPQWRMLGPLESVIGILMCGLSVSFLFTLVNRLIPASETQ